MDYALPEPKLKKEWAMLVICLVEFSMSFSIISFASILSLLLNDHFSFSETLSSSAAANFVSLAFFSCVVGNVLGAKFLFFARK